MKTLLSRAAVTAALLLPLSHAASVPAQAQHGAAPARYAAIGRAADHVLLLDQIDGIIYHCPTEYESRCFRRSHVAPAGR